MAAGFKCLRCGRRLYRTAAADASLERGSTWAYYDGVNLCPRCAERHSARERVWNIALATLVFASAPAAVAVINALRHGR